MTGDPQPPAPAETAVTAVDAAITDAVDAIQRTDDPDLAYRAATRLVELLRAAEKIAGPLRARAAARIQEAGRLSIAALGRRLGMSKARADQLLRASRPSKPK